MNKWIQIVNNVKVKVFYKAGEFDSRQQKEKHQGDIALVAHRSVIFCILYVNLWIMTRGHRGELLRPLIEKYIKAKFKINIYYLNEFANWLKIILSKI